MWITTANNAIFCSSLDPTVIMAELHELIRDFLDWRMDEGTSPSSVFPVFACVSVYVCLSVMERLISRLKTSRPNFEVEEAVVKLKGYRSHAVIEAALIAILSLGNWVCWTRSFIRFCISCPQEQNKLNLCFLLLCCSLTKWEIKMHFHTDHVT